MKFSRNQEPKTTTMSTTPIMSSADLFAQRNAGRAEIHAAAERFALDLAGRQAAWKRFQESPASFTPADARKLLRDCEDAEKLAQHFDDKQVGFLQNQFDESFFPRIAPAAAGIFTRELAEKLELQPGYIQRLVIYLEKVGKSAFGSSVTPEERDKALAERDRREADATVLEANILHARRAIAHFSAQPDLQTFNSCVAALGYIDFSQSVS